MPCHDQTDDGPVEHVHSQAEDPQGVVSIPVPALQAQACSAAVPLPSSPPVAMVP